MTPMGPQDGSQECLLPSLTTRVWSLKPRWSDSWKLSFDLYLYTTTHTPTQSINQCKKVSRPSQNALVCHYVMACKTMRFKLCQAFLNLLPKTFPYSEWLDPWWPWNTVGGGASGKLLLLLVSQYLSKALVRQGLTSEYFSERHQASLPLLWVPAEDSQGPNHRWWTLLPMVKCEPGVLTHSPLFQISSGRCGVPQLGTVYAVG